MMRFDTSQNLRLSQQMKMSPRMIQSMEILQLAAPALEERIDAELQNNIALEIDEPEGVSHEVADERRESQREDREGERDLVVNDANSAEGFDRLSELTSQYREDFDGQYNDFQPKPRRRLDGDRDAKMQAMNNTAARAESLSEQLLRQWSLTETDPDIDQAGRHLINFIDADGYLRTDLQTIANQSAVPFELDVLERAVDVLQRSLEPAGLAARDLRECLLIQLDAGVRDDPDHDDEVERTLVEDHLEDIENNRLPRIAQATGFSIEQIKGGLERLRHLDPRPGRRLASETQSVIIPDAIIEYDEDADEYVAALFDGRLPRLRISPTYSAMSSDKNVDQTTREFVDSRIRNARWLIEALDLRSNTLLRVIRLVIAHQREFFDYGPASLKPLPMTTIAEQLGVHVATVSRAVNGKWVQTPRGVLPLRKFFSAGLETKEGEDLAWDAVKENLKAIVDAEDKTHPLGDDKLAAALKERGISIARRTVAKYRDQLGIPTARMRKEF